VDGISGILQGQVHISQNGQTTPPPPPPTCDAIIPPSGTLIEDNTPCVTLGGQLSETTSGLGGHAYYSTLDTPDPDYLEGAFWLMNYAEAGNYDVFAWIPAGLSNLTAEAIYKIQFNGTAQKVSVDQAALAGGWAHLGNFPFAAGGDQWVRLGDNYANAANNGKTFVIDAIKVEPASGSAGSAGSGGGGTTGWPDGGSTTGGSSGWPDAGSSFGGSSGGSQSLPSSEDESAGCACRAGGRRGSGAPLLLLATLALGLTLRRRSVSLRHRA
jgi:hypothetical protein